MTEGEWKTNHFADPDVRKVLNDLGNELTGVKTDLAAKNRYIKWIEATYPNMRAEYKAIMDLEEAGTQTSGFAQAQVKAEGSHVSY